MTMEAATITMPYPEFVKLQQRAEANEQLATQLRAEIAELKTVSISADSTLVKTLLDGILSARVVMLFATGQLPPEEIRGWPLEAVRTLGKTLHAIKDLVPHEPDLRYHADDLLHFVKAIEDAEKVRRARVEGNVVVTLDGAA